MREIKFRAWDNALDKMLSMKEIESSGMNMFVLCEGINLVRLMQYTGLKDKNGKEIYEGDVFKLHDTIGYIAFHKNSASFRAITKIADVALGNRGWDNCNIEVIGNIYENPSLLEQS